MVLPTTVVEAQAHPKHILLTVIDDLGYDDLGFRNGGQIQTPVFNRLHSEGIELGQLSVQIMSA